MKFEEIYGRTYRGELSQMEAAEILGMSERTFRRWRDRYDGDGAEGLYDRRLGKVSARRVPVDTVIEVLEQFDTRYFDFTAKHFWDKLVSEHGFKRSYNWVRLTLQAHGRIRKARRRGAHRRKRPRRALPGMMLHQDASTHEWVPRPSRRGAVNSGQPGLALLPPLARSGAESRQTEISGHTFDRCSIVLPSWVVGRNHLGNPG